MKVQTSKKKSETARKESSIERVCVATFVPIKLATLS